VIILEIKNILKIALEFEKKGYALYSDVAKKTKNDIVRSIFEYLSQQEEKHVAEIEKYISKNKLEISGDSAKKTEEFFQTTVKSFKSKLNLVKADSVAYEKGLEIEKSAYEFYKSKLPSAKTEEVKKFLKFLMEQENAHYVLIQNAYEFSKDPKHFFAENERSIFEG
jgi:rubrerythrin